MLVVTVQFTVKPGFEVLFVERVQAQAMSSLEREPGCVQFDVCCNPADPRQVFLYEVYVDEGTFAAHLDSSYFSSFDRDTREWVADKAVGRWWRIGDDEDVTGV